MEIAQLHESDYGSRRSEAAKDAVSLHGDSAWLEQTSAARQDNGSGAPKYQLSTGNVTQFAPISELMLPNSTGISCEPHQRPAAPELLYEFSPAPSQQQGLLVSCILKLDVTRLLCVRLIGVPVGDQLVLKAVRVQMRDKPYPEIGRDIAP